MVQNTRNSLIQPRSNTFNASDMLMVSRSSRCESQDMLTRPTMQVSLWLSIPVMISCVSWV